MTQKKSVVISCLLCMLAVAAAVGVIFVMNRQSPPVGAPATSYGMLEISICFPAGEQKVRIWQAEDGMYYFFLPSGADDFELHFCNLATDSSLILGSDILTPSNPIINDLEYSKEYGMELRMSSGSQSLGQEQLIFLRSEGIPSLFIDTASGSMDMLHADKEVKEAASMRLFGADGGLEYSDALEYIKARGNTTFMAEKKPYQIKLPKSNQLLGLPAAEKWILLSNPYDDTLIKNEMVFRFAETYTKVRSIKGCYVDLYLNGNYAGNYYLCEKIEVGENRVDIRDLEKETEQINSSRDYENAELYISEDGKIKATAGLNNPQDITGGYLLEHLGTAAYASMENSFVTNGGHYYAIISPDPATVEQAHYICNLFNEMEEALAQADGIHPETGKHFSEYLNVDSWTSKYLMEEVFHDADAVARSMFFYKDSDSVDPLIYSGPMWDYDATFGNQGFAPQHVYGARQVAELGIYVREMMGHQEVREQVYHKFEEYVLPYVRYLARADVYRFSTAIQASARMNRVRWPYEYGYFSDDWAERDWLISFLEQKASFLQEYWLEERDYCTVTFLDYDGGIYKRYQIKRGEYLEAVPVISSYVAVFAGWNAVDGGQPFDSMRPILQDVTYESRWIPVELILQNGFAIADMDVSQVETDTLQAMVDQIRELQGAGENSKTEGERE